MTVYAYLGLAVVIGGGLFSFVLWVRGTGTTAQVASDAEQGEKSNAAMLKARTDVAADSAADSLRNHDF